MILIKFLDNQYNDFHHGENHRQPYHYIDSMFNDTLAEQVIMNMRVDHLTKELDGFIVEYYAETNFWDYDNKVPLLKEECVEIINKFKEMEGDLIE